MNRLSLIFVLFVTGCVAAKTFEPKPEALPAMEQKVPGITIERANQGYTLYKSKCASCHRLHAPSEYTIAKWGKSLNEMYPKAKVYLEDDKKLIRDYVFSLSK
jgi:hypothetical protein